MLNRRLLVYTSGGGSGPAGLVITVIDYDTKQPVANAKVCLCFDGNSVEIQLGFTDSSGVLIIEDFRLPPGEYAIQAGITGYITNRIGYIVLNDAPINDSIEIEIQKMMLPPDE